MGEASPEGTFQLSELHMPTIPPQVKTGIENLLVSGTLGQDNFYIQDKQPVRQISGTLRLGEALVINYAAIAKLLFGHLDHADVVKKIGNTVSSWVTPDGARPGIFDAQKHGRVFQNIAGAPKYMGQRQDPITNAHIKDFLLVLVHQVSGIDAD